MIYKVATLSICVSLSVCGFVQAHGQAIVPEPLNLANLGYMSFNGPCGVTIPQGWITPPVWAGTLQSLPAPLAQQCGVFNMFSWSTTDNVAPPTGSATYGVISASQNVPLPTIEISPDGSMLFDFMIGFEDTTATQFNGKFDVTIDIPFDATSCALLSSVAGLQPSSLDGLYPYTEIIPCLLITPSQYVAAQQMNHSIGWASYGQQSMTLYGPTSPVPANTPSELIQSGTTPVYTSLQVPYSTTVSSTVVRVGMRMSEGYGNQMPLAWGCWQGNCNNNSEIQPLYNGAMQGGWLFSQPFTVQISPAYLIQYDYLPAFILYQAPGDASFTSFQFSTEYSEQYTAGSTISLTSTSDIDEKTSTDISFSESGKVENYFSDNVGYKQDSSWDNDVKSSMGSSYGDSVSSLLSNTSTTSYSTPSLGNTATPDASLGFYQQPYWSDTVYFLIHPQFAIWVYPDGVVAQPLGAAALESDTIQDFNACMGTAQPVHAGKPITYNYSLYINNNIVNQPPFTLQPADCANILQLDPYWVATTEAATPPMGLPVTSGSVPMSINAINYTNQQVSSYTTETDGTQTFNATVSATASNSTNDTISATVLGASLGFSPTISFSNADGQQLQIQLSTKQSQTTEQTLTSKITLQDCPLVSGKDSCAPPAAGQPGPSSVVTFPFQDARFGTMMASTPYLSPKKPITLTCIPCLNLGRVLANGTAFKGIAIYDDEATASAGSSLYRVSPGAYGFKYGEVPNASQLVLDLTQFRSGPGATKPMPRLQPLPPPRKRAVTAAPPLQYKRALPAPKSLAAELPALKTKFPQIGTASNQKPPAGQVYPRTGTVKTSSDGRLQLVQ